MDLLALNDFRLAIIELHIHILVNIVIQHRWVDQIERAGRDEDTEKTVEPDWTIDIFFKARD